MTKKEIEKVGFVLTNFAKKMYYLPSYLGESISENNIHIDSQTTTRHIIETYYNLGIEKGIEIGKQQKINEIKRILNIDYEQYEH